MAFTSSQQDEIFNIMMNFSNRELFASNPVTELFEENMNAIKREIDNRTENELLNVDIDIYADYFCSKYTIDYPIIDESNYAISSFETEIPAIRFPVEFAVADHQSPIPRDVIVFHVPFSGNINLLNYKPSTLNLSAVQPVKIENSEILFRYINFYDKPEVIKSQFENELKNFMRRYALLQNEISSFNSNLKKFSTHAIMSKRDSYLRKSNFLLEFNVPLKSKADTSTTFTVPSPQLRKKIILPPDFNNTQYKPDPTLSKENYRHILTIINDVGKNFERMPSTFKSKKEEDLRDHFILTLDPNFELGSVTGETFNKKGKTDIMLRYDSSVLFVAECKFWTGEKGLHQTIDQLLGYLTWRETKTAIILFVKNKDIHAVIANARKAISSHQQMANFVSEVADNWTEYNFSLPENSGKNIILSLMLFHLPQSG